MSKTGRTIGAIIVLLGAVLLIATVFVPWYTESASFSGPVAGSWTSNTYPGLADQNGTVQSSCSGHPANGCPPSQTSYKGADLNNTGSLVQTGYYLLLAGFFLGLIGAIIGLAARKRPGGAVAAGAVAVVAMLLALAIPVLFAVQLPGAISKDDPTATGSGPWSSFMGSATTNLGFGESMKLTWGPTTGWYLAFVAFVVLLIGAIVLFGARKEPTSPAPTSVPEPTPSTTAAPVSEAPPTS